MLEQYQRALVTGGCGLIGSHLTEALLSLGKEVTVLDNCSIEAEANVPAGASLVRGDVRKLGEVNAAVLRNRPGVSRGGKRQRHPVYP